MRNIFAEYYKPDFDKLWSEAVFIFDTNVLLDLYRFPKTSADSIIKNLKQINKQQINRFWLPYQVGIEFHRSKEGVKEELGKDTNNINDTISKNYDEIKKEIQKVFYLSKPSQEEKETIEDLIKNAEQSLSKQIEKIRKKHFHKMKALKDIDYVEDFLLEIFHNNIGLQYSEERLKELYKTCETRYKCKIPPGYEDCKKPEPDKYGDFILWHQILDFAKENNRSVIFITGDGKEDWYLKVNGKNKGPRPELRAEFNKITDGQEYYSYTLDYFLNYANQYLKINTKPDVIEEVKQVQQEKLDIKPFRLPEEESRAIFLLIERYSSYVKNPLKPISTDLVDDLISDCLKLLNNPSSIKYVIENLFEFKMNGVINHHIFRAFRNARIHGLYLEGNNIKLLKALIMDKWKELRDKIRHESAINDFTNLLDLQDDDFNPST